MDDRAFDDLVRNVTASSQTRRRAIALAGLGFVISLARPLAEDGEAAPRRQGGRKKNDPSRNGKRGNAGKGSGGSKSPGRRGHEQCDSTETCPRDPETGKPGFRCSDGLCSCGGTCCEKGYACYVEESNPGREICCFVDSAQSPVPEKADYTICPGELVDPTICCDAQLCQSDGSCPSLTLGRYRRNPR